MKLFVSALEYSANVHLKYLLRELALRENIELCGIFDEKMVLDSANSQNLVKNKSREAQPLASSGVGEGVVREGEGSDFAIQAPAPSLKENARSEKGESKADLSAQARDKKRDSSVVSLPQNDNLMENAESSAFSISGKSLCDIENIAVMGFIDVLKKAKFFLDLRKKCLNLALTADKILLMDSSSFNIPLAKMIKSSNPNKRIAYYILPQVWAWKPWRAKVIEANCDKLAAILPFEVGRYEKKAEFVGHPLLDEIKQFREMSSLANSSCGDFLHLRKVRFLDEPSVLSASLASHKCKNSSTILEFASCNKNAESSLDSATRGQIAESSPIFSFMPGSRFGEIKRIFPIFLQVKDALKSREKGAKFHLIIPKKFASQNLAQIYGDLSDFHISFDAHRSLFQSRFAFICSGTATLECALIGTPFVLGYKCRAFEAFIARCFLKIKFIGLANILYEKISPNEIFHTELIQGDLSAQNLLNALDSADKDEFLCKSLALRKYLKNGSAKAVAKMLYDL